MLKTTMDVLQTVKSYLPENPIIVEAGAFIGHDTQRMAIYWPNGSIHAFEPVPQIFERLQQNMHHQKNVTCYQLALSNQVGQAHLFVAEKPTRPGVPSQASSLLAPKERLKFSSQQFNQTIEVTTTTLDRWAQTNNITHVDFLWLDLQGSELAVLKGAPNILQKVQAIYLEVQFIESYHNNPLYPEVKGWLAQNNFIEIARDFDEHARTFFGNILVVKKS